MNWDETDELEDYEYPDEPDYDEDEELYVKCEECGADVYEDAPNCPECGHYITESARTALPTHWKIVAIIALIAFALGALSLF